LILLTPYVFAAKNRALFVRATNCCCSDTCSPSGVFSFQLIEQRLAAAENSPKCRARPPEALRLDLLDDDADVEVDVSIEEFGVSWKEELVIGVTVDVSTFEFADPLVDVEIHHAFSTVFSQEYCQGQKHLSRRY
jgi:hypothetical protein